MPGPGLSVNASMDQREPRRPPTLVPDENAAAPLEAAPEDRLGLDAARDWLVWTGVDPVPPRRLRA